MITIENALNILKNDHNFREIIDKGQYFYHYRDLVFKKISYDSREVDASTLFFVKGDNFKTKCVSIVESNVIQTANFKAIKFLW